MGCARSRTLSQSRIKHFAIWTTTSAAAATLMARWQKEGQNYNIYNTVIERKLNPLARPLITVYMYLFIYLLQYYVCLIGL